MAGSQSTIRHVVLTGPPGVGKTTLVRKVCEKLRAAGVQTKGFYTEEVRAGGRRTGFDVVTLDGERGPLARVSGESDTVPGAQKRSYRVGQYSVELQAFEQVALPSLSVKPTSSPSKVDVLVIDEVGKMELFSQNFIQTIRTLFSKPGHTVLATIPIPKGKPLPLVEEIRHRADTRVFTISRDNRDRIFDDIFAAIQSARS